MTELPIAILVIAIVVNLGIFWSRRRRNDVQYKPQIDTLRNTFDAYCEYIGDISSPDPHPARLNALLTDILAAAGALAVTRAEFTGETRAAIRAGLHTAQRRAMSLENRGLLLSKDVTSLHNRVLTELEKTLNGL